MSLSAWVNKSAARVVAGEEVQEGSNGHHREAVVVGANARYPLLVEDAQVVGSEHFGVLRTRILTAQAKSGFRSLVVTSAEKEEGKSLVCLNLAISLGKLQKHRVLLVDGDLRVKGISQVVGIEGEPGVSDFLRGLVDIEGCIRPTNLTGVSVAGAGTHEEDCLPTILEGRRWPDFLDRAKQLFDLIIVDSVPVTAPIADFELVSAPCDAMLLIVHLRKTSREALNSTLRQMDHRLIGVVINNQEPRVGYDYYSYKYAKKT